MIYLNVGNTLSKKSRMKRSHSRDKVPNHNTITPMKNFTSDKNIINLRLRMKRFNMCNNPLTSRINLRQRLDITVGCRHSDGDAGVRESLKDLRTNVEDLDTVDDCVCF